MVRDLTLDRALSGVSIDIGSVDCTVYIFIYILSTLSQTVIPYHNTILI